MTLDLLRFTTAGSVDDGKSTLIGRLLYDAKQVFEDQLEHVAQASERRGGEGTLDLAVMYRPVLPPGLASEHLFDEEFVWVRSARTQPRRAHADYLSIDWGPEFLFDHATAYPDLSNPGLHLDLGSAGLDYLIAHSGSSYVPLRLVKIDIARGRLRLNKRARKFVYPVYMVYPEARDEEAFEPILHGLRNEARRVAKDLG